jgi:class 3 adenylate cyclase/tetratricopeptide (TPR) repeat protein
LCPSCRAKLEAGAKFCPSCGAAVGRAGGYGVELREVACLASDVQGLIELEGRIPPRRVSEFAAECMAALDDVCATHAGTVVSRQGAGLTAIFGAPVAREREVELAVGAAFALRERVADISQRAYAETGRSLSTRSAVDFGVVRGGGYPATAEYAAIGSPVEGAAALRNNARPNTIILSTAAADQVRGLFQLKSVSLGTATPKGLARTGYLVEGFTDLLAGVTDRREVFVGREAELSKLAGVLEDLRAGRGRAVGISGGAGIGKTRLVAEALVASEGVRSFVSKCLPVKVGASYGAFRTGLADALARFPGGNYLERAENLLASSQPELVEAVPLLSAVLEPRLMETHITEQLRGVARFDKLYELFEAIWGKVAEEAPTVLVLEDAQWASNADFLLLSRFASRVPALPLLLIVTARKPEALKRVTSDIIELSPLSNDKVAELVRALIPPERLSPGFLRRIIAWAKGNPLYCEQVAAAVLSRGLGEAFKPPASIKAAARARADGLSSKAQQAAKIAACIGPEGELELWRAVVPAGIAGTLDDLITELERFGVLRVSGNQFSFGHEVVAEVLEDSLVKKERNEIYSAIARAAGARDAAPEMVAHYLLEADRSRDAVEHLKEAGDRAAASYALSEAVSHYRRALDCVREAGPTAAGLRIELVEKLSSCLLDYADPRGSLEVIEEELNNAAKPAVQAKLLYLAGNAYSELGENRKARLYLEDARNIYSALNEPLMEGKVIQSLVKVLVSLGEEGARRRAIAEALARFTEAGDDVNVAYCYNIIGSDYLNADEPSRALEYFKDGLNIWQQAGDLSGQAIALTNLGYAHYLLGYYHDAAGFADRALKITRRIGTRRTQATAICNMVAYYLYLEPSKAEEYGREAITLAESIPNYEILSGAHINVGELERCRGSWDKARRHVAAALRAADKVDSQARRFYAELLGAKIELDAGTYDAEAFGRHYEAVFAIEPPSRETAALVRANLEADLAMARGDERRAAELVDELLTALEAAKKTEEVFEGRLRLGELKMYLGNEAGAATEFERVMSQADGRDFLHWPRAAFRLAQSCVALGRAEDAGSYLELAGRVFEKYGWKYWSDQVTNFRREHKL